MWHGYAVTFARETEGSHDRSDKSWSAVRGSEWGREGGAMLVWAARATAAIDSIPHQNFPHLSALAKRREREREREREKNCNGGLLGNLVIRVKWIVHESIKILFL